jgi:3-oxoacyl-[acyl-carrier protein] reductase
MAASTLEPALKIRKFEDLQVGEECRLTRTLTAADVDAFARVSGDINPLHMDDTYARENGFRGRVVHGVLLASFVSTAVGMQLPGPGSLWTQQSFRWRLPVYIGDTITITLKVTFKSPGTRTVSISLAAVNQTGTLVMEGEGAVKLLEDRAVREEVPMQDRLALVTGSAKGIGAAIATALAEAGATVAVHYHNSRDEAAGLCQALEAEGRRAFAVRADVTDPESVAAAVAQLQEHFGRPVDILVNNAGTSSRAGAFLETPWDTIQSALDVHLKGAYHCCQRVLPGMLERGSGIVVNIGFAGSAPQLPFTVAKSALRGLTRSLAHEYGPKGIRVNMVSPGMVETPGGGGDVPERIRKLQAMQAPLRKLCTPRDVAQTVLFLCSDAGRLITGADIPVSGGLNPA